MFRELAYTNLIILHAPPRVFNAFLPIVRSEDVNDAKIVDLIFVLIVFIRRPNATFILIEHEIFTLGLLLLWQLIRAIR